MKGDYEVFQALRRQKNEPNLKPNKAKFRQDGVLGAEGLRLPQSLRSFAMTLVGYLKKQSQYAQNRDYGFVIPVKTGIQSF